MHVWSYRDLNLDIKGIIGLIYVLGGHRFLPARV